MLMKVRRTARTRQVVKFALFTDIPDDSSKAISTRFVPVSARLGLHFGKYIFNFFLMSHPSLYVF
jgi:hypothetical protein